MTSPGNDWGRSGGDRATPTVLLTFQHRIAQRTRAAIERAAVWGFIPAPLAQRLVHWIGGRDE